jgi:hypothetical protein
VTSSAVTPARLMQLEDYVPILGVQEVDDLRALARRLAGRTVQMVN